MKLFEWLAGLLILIPFSVDQRLSIELGQYTLRPQYLGTALWLGLWIRRTSVKTVLKSLKSPENLFFAGLGVSGLAAVLISAPETRRGMFFLVWTIGTLVVVPAVARDIYGRFGRKAVVGLAGYYAIQALVIVLDAGICIPSDGRFSIGRVMIYNWIDSIKLCRPSAFYQEPGYFAATAALVITLIRVYKACLAETVGSYPAFLVNLALRLALVLSLSRLGWLILGVVLIFDIRDYLRSRTTRSSFHYKKTILTVSVLLALIGGLFGNKIYLYLGRPDPKIDGSMQSRTRSLTMALDVFKTHPLVGVGPGGASRSYYLSHEQEIPETEKSSFQGAPLSQSLYGELLSEWGLIGSLFFTLGLLLTLRRVPYGYQLETTGILALIYASTQTLPRYDLWFLIGLLTIDQKQKTLRSYKQSPLQRCIRNLNAGLVSRCCATLRLIRSTPNQMGYIHALICSTFPFVRRYRRPS